MGKTALVVHWGHRVADRFPGGQLYLNLRGHDLARPVPTADALAMALRTLGVPDAEVPPTLDERVGRYRTLLADRRALIVLDNAADADQVRGLLPGAGPSVVVVTSRDALVGLVARDGARRIELTVLPVHEAVGLLRVLVGARVDEEPEAAGALVQRCARLPLALRIAAELVRARPDRRLADLVAQLSDERRTLDLLDAGGDPRTAVRSVLSWSCRGLPPPVVRLFRLLGLHPGRDFDARSAAALAGVDPDDATDALAVLARAHLVEPLAGKRFRMHDLLRAYAAEMAGDEPVTGLLDFYLATCTTAAALRYPAFPLPTAPPHPAAPALDERSARAWLTTEIDNVVAAVGFAAERGLDDHVTRLATAVARHLYTTGRTGDAETVHTHAVRSARATADRAAEGLALRNLGMAVAALGRREEAIEHFERSLAIRAELGDRLGMAEVWTSIGVAQDILCRFTEAIASQERALALRLSAGDRVGAAIAMLNLGVVLEQRGDLERSKANHERALALFREHGDRVGESHALTNLGNVLRLLGDPESAITHHRRALTAYRDLGSRTGEAFALAGLGSDLDRLGEHTEATDWHQQALDLAREISETSLEAEVLNNLGENLTARHRPGDAHTAHTAALTIATPHGDALEQARALHRLGALALAEGDKATARTCWTRSAHLYAPLGVAESALVHANLTALDDDPAAEA
ncbi:ATP-binding protein [Actinokineospora soli]|uniref:ATP-binding protein n=1 Tax=Actinokineospora soli TaxID=1048753 RepID=A0ABW2TU23_9PSEU